MSTTHFVPCYTVVHFFTPRSWKQRHSEWVLYAGGEQHHGGLQHARLQRPPGLQHHGVQHQQLHSQHRQPCRRKDNLFNVRTDVTFYRRLICCFLESCETDRILKFANPNSWCLAYPGLLERGAACDLKFWKQNISFIAKDNWSNSGIWTLCKRQRSPFAILIHWP